MVGRTDILLDTIRCSASDPERGVFSWDIGVAPETNSLQGVRPLLVGVNLMEYVDRVIGARISNFSIPRLQDLNVVYDSYGLNVTPTPVPGPYYDQLVDGPIFLNIQELNTNYRRSLFDKDILFQFMYEYNKAVGRYTRIDPHEKKSIYSPAPISNVSKLTLEFYTAFSRLRFPQPSFDVGFSLDGGGNLQVSALPTGHGISVGDRIVFYNIHTPVPELSYFLSQGSGFVVSFVTPTTVSIDVAVPVSPTVDLSAAFATVIVAQRQMCIPLTLFSIEEHAPRLYNSSTPGGLYE